MDVILDRGSTPLTSRKTKGSQREPFVFVIPARACAACTEFNRSERSRSKRESPIITVRLNSAFKSALPSSIY